MVQRYGVKVIAGDGPNSEKPLGLWPQNFATDYPQTSWIGRAGGVRKSVLRHVQNYHEQNLESHSAKVSGRTANLPNNDARVRRMREAQKARDLAVAQRNGIDEEVFAQKIKMQPFDKPSSLYEIHLQESYRRTLAAQPDEKARVQLLQSSRAFRAAALSEDGHPALSGLSQSTYDSFRSEAIAQRYPAEVKAIADHGEADKLLGNVLDALDMMLENEAKSLGVPLNEPQDKPPTPEWD